MLNRIQSCNERYGWDFFYNWINNNQNYLSHGNSQLDCMRNTKTNTLCKISNVIIDYSKIKIINNVRSVDYGFVLIYGDIKSDYFDFPEVIPGIKFTQDIQNIICDEIETRPTYVLSNDDIFNLGHYMNDVMMIWTMILLSNNNPSNSLLVNIDGLLENTPSGGLAHRIMDNDNPDNHGPYSLYYETWFNEIKKGIDYKNKKVCYKELYFPILPNIAWIWNDWFVENICSIQAPSPLFQSFNLFIRDHIIKKYPNTLQYDESIITILIDTRKDSKNNKKSSSRVIINIDSLIEAIKSVAFDNIKVISIDYSELSFLEQIKIAHSASIFVGMHGAGRAHIIHAAIGMRNCCGFIELFPDESMDFYTIHGYSNLARMLGFHTYKYIPTLGSTNSSGTLLDVSSVTELVFKTINDVKYRPTCLHDIKNTSLPIFTLNPIT